MKDFVGKSPKAAPIDHELEFARKVKAIGERFNWDLRAFNEAVQRDIREGNIAEATPKAQEAGNSLEYIRRLTEAYFLSSSLSEKRQFVWEIQKIATSAAEAVKEFLAYDLTAKCPKCKTVIMGIGPKEAVPTPPETGEE